MATILEGAHPGNFMLSEWDADYSREEGRLFAGTAQIRVGQLVSKRTDNNEIVSWIPGAGNGVGTLVGIAWDTYTNPPSIGTAPARIAYVARDAVVNADKLDYNGQNVTVAVAALKAIGIMPRDGV
jgi:hypothetical protein